MKRISSMDNQYLKFARKLASKKHRDSEHMFLIEGQRSVQEALKNNLVKILFLETDREEGFALDNNCQNINCYRLDSRLMRSISFTESPPGIIAIASIPQWPLEMIKDSSGPLLLLDQIADPGNLGTIIRSAWALGVEGIMLTKGSVDPFSPKVVRASMGGILNMPLYREITVETVIDLKKRAYNIIGADLDARESCYSVDFKSPTIFLMGSEARGISQEWKKICDKLVRIPMNPRVDSLNVGVACAIIIAEAWRQRNGGSVLF